MSENRMLNSPLYRFFIGSGLIAGLFISTPVYSQDGSRSLRHELGFWVGPSTPAPGTLLDPVLDSTIGGGAFYRLNRPWIFSTELGTFHASYASRTTQKVTLTPVYMALVYQLPIPAKFQFLVKAGGGYSQVETRPLNRIGWEPMYMAGGEFAIMASRHFRIGIRLDYNYIYESWMEAPKEQQYLLYYNLLNRPPEQPIDLRYYQLENGLKKENGEFLHFGIMMSFIL